MVNVKFLPDKLSPTNSGKVCLSVRPLPEGFVATVTLGHKFHGDEKITILAVKEVPSKQAAQEWFARQLKTRPWETRQ